MSTPIKILTLILVLHTTVSSYQCVVQGEVALELASWAVVCIHLYFQGSNDTRTYAFNTTVDSFSALKISGIKEDIASDDSSVTAILQFQNTGAIYPMLISDAQKYREVFSFVVGIEDGVYKKITLDNAGCDVCDTSGNQVCSGANNQCFQKSDVYKGGDPIFYISWVGIDSAKNHMLSHTKRLSRFYQYSVGSVYQKAKSLVSKLL